MAGAATCALFCNAPTWKCVCRQVSNTRVSIRASSTPTSCTVCRGRKVSWCCRSRRRRSRRYARRTLRRRSSSPTDLLRHPLIQSDNKQVRWPAWFALNGIAVPSTSRGLRFDRSFLAIAVAADGLGIALDRPFWPSAKFRGDVSLLHSRGGHRISAMSATTSSILLLSSGGCSSGYLLNGWHASWISSSLPSCKRENDDASGHSPGQDGFHCERRLIQMIFPLSSTCNSV